MKETQMPPAHAANLVANSDYTAYVVESIRRQFHVSESEAMLENYWHEF